MPKHHLKTYVTVQEYAKEKGVSVTSVRYRIDKGDIAIILVGKSQVPMIDYATHADIEFDQSKNRYKK